MKTKTINVSIATLLLLILTECSAPRMPVQPTTKIMAQGQALKTIERVLNTQYRNDIGNIYIDTSFYKVGLLKTRNYGGGQPQWHYAKSSIKSQIVYYNEISRFLILEYRNHYNLLIYNMNGKEINKVLCANLGDIYGFIDAVRNLQGKVSNVSNTKEYQGTQSLRPYNDNILQTYSLKDETKNIEKHNTQCINFSLKGKLNESINCYQSILQQDARNFTALDNVGYAFLNTGNNKEALSYFTKCFHLFCNNADDIFMDSFSKRYINFSPYIKDYLIDVLFGTALAYFYNDNLQSALKYTNLAKVLQPILSDSKRGFAKFKANGWFYSKRDDDAITVLLSK